MDERTKIAMPIASWWHLLVIVGTILFVYFGMKNDIASAIEQSSRNSNQIEEIRKTVDVLRMDQIEIKAGLGYFRQQYETDQKKSGLR